MTIANVSFDSSVGQADGYIRRPGAGKPGVVVLQEWWGLVPHIQHVADRFVRHGFVALSPDLYHGKSTVEAEEAHHLMTGLDWSRAAQEIAGAVKHLREKEGCTRVGVTGFCMGGALTIIAAATAGVDSYAAFYGFPPRGAAPLEQIEAPGLIFFGENEDFFSVPDAQSFAEAQRRQNRECEVVIYPGAGHAFFNDTRPEAYQAAAADDAWRRTLDLFARTLKE